MCLFCGCRVLTLDQDGDRRCFTCGRPPRPLRAPEPHERQCPNCGARILYGRRPDVRYCNKRCLALFAGRAYYARERAKQPRTYPTVACAHCGRPYTRTRRTRRFCSLGCNIRAQTAARIRKREALRLAA